MSAPRLINPPPASGGVPVGGSGTAGTLPIWTASSTLGDSAIVQVSGAIKTLVLTTAGTGGTAANYREQALTNVTGTGSGATADISVVAGAVTQVFLRGPGTGYAVGDTLSAAITGLTGAVFTVTAITTSDNAAGNVTANRIAAGSSSATTGLSTNTGMISTAAPIIFGTSFSGGTTQWRTGLLVNPDSEPLLQTALTATENSVPAGIGIVGRWNMSARVSNTNCYGILTYSVPTTPNASGSSFSYGGQFNALFTGAPFTGATTNGIGVWAQVNVQASIGSSTFTTFYGYDTSLSCSSTSAQAITNAGYFVPRVASFTAAAHVISNFYGVYLPTTTLTGGATITSRYGVYQQDPNAANFWFGKTNFSASATSDTAGNAAAQIIGVQNGGLSYLWMRQRATDTSISIDTYGSSWAEALRLNTNTTAGGQNTVQIPTAGWGLKLPSTPGNSDSQALDAYREGTRVLAAGDLSGWTYNTATQYWTLVGRTVTLHTVFSGGTSSALGGATIATPPLLTPLRIAAGSAVNSAGTALGNGVCVCGPTSGTTGVVQNSSAIASSAVDKVLTVTYETAGL